MRVFVGDIGLGISRGLIKSLSRNSKALVKRRKMPNDASIRAEKDELMLLERNCKNIYFLYAGNRFQASPLQMVGESFVLFFKQRLKKIRGSVAFGKEEENQAQQTCLEMIRHGGEQQRWCWRVCVTSAAASL